MKTKISLLLSLFVATAMIAISVMTVSAQGEAIVSAADNIGYPIAELGGCKDKAACKTYCEKPENMRACVAYAEKSGLLTGENLHISKIVAEKVFKKETPGGCATKAECEEFCQGKVENINACVAFGEGLGVIPKEQLAEAKKIVEALRKGAKMPGACKTKNDCEKYCSISSHIDECLSFAEVSGIISPEQLAEARKVAPFLKNGETPGKCTTKETCDAYCKEASHVDECIGFAEKAGFITAEEATMAKKVGGAGPGGCKGKDSCMTYCNEDEHAAECANFAKEKGLLTEKQKEDIDTGVDRMKAGLAQIPEEVRGEVITCLENSIGKEKFDRIMAKQDMPTQSIGGKIENCFANVAELMKAKMMNKAMQQGGQGGTSGGQAPTKEQLMQNIPDNVPPEIREQIEAQIKSGMPPAGSMIPPTGTGGNIPPPNMMPPADTMIPAGTPLPAGMTSTGGPDCSVFASVPSCDVVPGSGHDYCVKCKGQ